MKRGVIRMNVALWPFAKLRQLLQSQTTGVHFVNGNLLHHGSLRSWQFSYHGSLI